MIGQPAEGRLGGFFYFMHLSVVSYNFSVFLGGVVDDVILINCWNISKRLSGQL